MTSGQVANVKDLAALYDTDNVVKNIFREFGENLGDFFCEIIPEVKPEMIMMGGNIAESFEYFQLELMKRLSDHQMDLPVRKSILKEHASLLGAASCWSDMGVLSE